MNPRAWLILALAIVGLTFAGIGRVEQAHKAQESIEAVKQSTGWKPDCAGIRRDMKRYHWSETAIAAELEKEGVFDARLVEGEK